MGVTLALVGVDHELVVNRGLTVVNRALAANAPSILRDYLRTLPVASSAELVSYHQDRVMRLEQLKAPPAIVDIERRALEEVSGRAIPELIESGGMDELRDLLGSWGWRLRTYDLDRAYSGLHWYCDPEQRKRNATSAAAADGLLRADGRSARLTPTTSFDFAIVGEQPYPLDNSGRPIIRTRGTPGDDTSRYNPPERVSLIHAAIENVDPDSWEALVSERVEALTRQKERTNASIAAHDRSWDRAIDPVEVDERAREELEYLRNYFPIFAAAYRKSAEKGHGVSVEYSL